MNYEVIVSCAVTGAGDTVGKSPLIPVTQKKLRMTLLNPRKQVQQSRIYMSVILKLEKVHATRNCLRKW